MSGPDLNLPPSSPPQRPTSASRNYTYSGSPNSRSPRSSRRPSQAMGPPVLPTSPSAATMGGPVGASPLGADSSAALRQPRPMSAADLHFILEREQEAVVNRLTKELALLRSQTASVASTASSSSTGLSDPIDTLALYAAQYPNGPTPARRHRSSSSLSIHLPTASSGASIAPSRDSAVPSTRPSGEFVRNSRSRTPSVGSQRSPINSYGEQVAAPHSYAYSHSHNGSISHQRPSMATTVAGSTRFEEVTQQRAELEAVKKENEQLRRRVRELEHNLRSSRRGVEDDHADDASSTSNLIQKMKATSLTAAL